MWICYVIIVVGIPLIASGKMVDLGFWIETKFMKKK